MKKKSKKIIPVYLTIFVYQFTHFRKFVWGLYVFRINKA